MLSTSDSGQREMVTVAYPAVTRTRTDRVYVKLSPVHIPFRVPWFKAQIWSVKCMYGLEDALQAWGQPWLVNHNPRFSKTNRLSFSTSSPSRVLCRCLLLDQLQIASTPPWSLEIPPLTLEGVKSHQFNVYWLCHTSESRVRNVWCVIGQRCLSIRPGLTTVSDHDFVDRAS